jgi:glycosyltransferase involved in cell wall biosynthesis
MNAYSLEKSKVLLFADDCNPCWPSLPVVGYNLCKAISKQVPMVLATHIRNKKNLEQYPISNVDVVYIDNEYMAKRMYQIGTFFRSGSSVGWTTQIALSYPSYLAFEWEVWKKLKKEIRSGQFALIHRITPMTPTLPSFLSRQTQVPFVIGPLNGGLAWPKEYLKELNREREWATWIRKASHYLPYYKSTYSKSKAILAAFKHTAADLPADAQAKTINFPEVGFDPSLFYPKKDSKNFERITFLYVGRLVPYKNPDVAVAALAASPILKIVGEGPEMPALKKYIQENQLENCVELMGNKTQQEVSCIMRESDVFVFPSVRELGAGVVVEAMACGLCCIVVDYGGPAELVAPERGVKVALKNKEKLIASFAIEMENLIHDPNKIKRLGLNAQQYVSGIYTWESKAKQMIHVYNWVLGKEPVKPHFSY